MLFPIIPSSSKRILEILNMDINNFNFKNINDLPKSNFKINQSKPIFPRI